MIHYHGGPLTPNAAALAIWTRRHACISFARPDQLELAAEITQSFILDNGAFSAWKHGAPMDWPAYYAWAGEWLQHPGCDFAIMPDVIDGTELQNDRLLARWPYRTGTGVPVWHLHESLGRLASLCAEWPRVALGSSGAFADPRGDAWWHRIGQAMNAVCDASGRPASKLHGLRMLSPTIFSQLPLASADSTNIARNIGVDAKWERARYAPKSKALRALILADRIEHHASAITWQGRHGHQHNPELIG